MLTKFLIGREVTVHLLGMPDSRDETEYLDQDNTDFQALAMPEWGSGTRR